MLLEEQRSPAKKLLRGQQEDGERWRGKAATQAERLTQGVGSQVGPKLPVGREPLSHVSVLPTMALALHDGSEGEQGRTRHHPITQ